MDEQEIKKRVDDLHQQMVDTLCDLIVIPTANPPGDSYEPCTHYLTRILESWQVDHRIITAPHKDNNRFSIIGSHGYGTKGLHFHGHYDVVPADSARQFRPEIKENRVYGRGSADMKSGLVVMLFALRILRDMGIKLKGKLSFSIVPDEETGGKLGTEYLFKSGLLPQTSLVGMLMPEVTSGVIWHASKGALTYKIEVIGKSAHVALAHEGENSFEHMVTLAHSFLELKKKIAGRVTKLSVTPPEAKRSNLLLGGESGSGVNFNIVPQRAFFTIDRRFNPEERMQDVEQEIKEVLDKNKKKGMKLEVEVIQEGDSSLSSPTSQVAEVLSQAIYDITGKKALFSLCPGLCETRFFSQRGIPAYAYGPGLLEYAHGPGEFVEIDRMLDCTKVYALTALRLLNG